MKPLYIKPINKCQTRRARWNDYRSRGIYMITITAEPGAPPFGTLDGGLGRPFIRLTEAGRILEHEITDTPARRPAIRLLAHKVMPDHAHMILFVTEATDDHLGKIIAGIKGAVTSKIRKLFPEYTAPVFSKNYNDRKVYGKRQLDILIRYVADNPRRLAIIRNCPDLFRRYNHLRIDGREYAAYGNIFLLRDFDKKAVIIHRGYSGEELTALKQQWLQTSANGGVLVSPFISQAEKEVRDEAIDAGGKLIILRPDGFESRFKPSGKEFRLCTEGRLLLLAPWPEQHIHTTITRSQALQLNAMAQTIASTETASVSLCGINDK